MNPRELDECLGHAREAALLAWKEIQGFFRGDFRIFEKENDGPATEADIAADHFIVDYLQARYPSGQFGYLSEETQQGHERLDKPYCWIIDPIDGTREFIEGRDDFAMHIGLAGPREDGAGSFPLVGVVYMPRAGTLYGARHGGGAFGEAVDSAVRRPVRVTGKNEVERATVIVTRQQIGRRLAAAIDGIKAADIIQRGSFGVKVIQVANGNSDLYLNTSQRHSKEWDALAPHAILNEAGGIMTDLTGADLIYNRRDVYLRQGAVASNSLIHDEVVSRLGKVRELWESIH